MDSNPYDPPKPVEEPPDPPGFRFWMWQIKLYNAVAVIVGALMIGGVLVVVVLMMLKVILLVIRR